MSILIKGEPHRRTVLRGLMKGLAVGVALPFLDCFLTDNGDAIAATGAPLPVRFGTWYWGLGLTPNHSIKEKTKTGAGIEFLEESRALEAVGPYLNFYSGFNMPLDGRANFTHYSGWVASRTGVAPSFTGDIPAPTIDLLVADQIAGRTRFQTIDATSIGDASQNFSARSTNARSAAEKSPMALYTRLFGAEFADPNKADWRPDPGVLVRQSVLSAVGDQARRFIATLGSADKARFDEYFTSIRQVETQLALQLEKPAPNQACAIPRAPDTTGIGERVAAGLDVETVTRTHGLMSTMIAMAVACNQTNIFNMAYSDPASTIRRPGETYHHHLLTHEEAIDQTLGYQPVSFYFGRRAMENFATFISAFARIREGDGALLDNVLIFASTETNYARLHSIDGLPMFTAGRAGGQLKSGYHVVGGGDPVTSVGLTCMRAMGVPLDKWGARSLETSKVITEILV